MISEIKGSKGITQQQVFIVAKDKEAARFLLLYQLN